MKLRTGGGLALAALCLLSACLAPQLCRAECTITLPDATALEAAGMEDTVAALTGIWRKLNGSRWRFRDMSEVLGTADTAGTLSWGSCRSCRVNVSRSPSSWHDGPVEDDALLLPSYCCWRGVSCCHEPRLQPDSGGGSNRTTTVRESSIVSGSRFACRRYAVTSLSLWGLNLAGPFHAILPELQTLHDHGLRVLDMSKNALTGSLPPELGGLRHLTGLLLGSNNITGTVPTSLRELVQLQQLDLQLNKLGGSLNHQLCPEDNSLRVVAVRGNNLAGPLDLRNCSHLMLADIQGNRFTGPLPVDGSNRALSVLEGAHNFFSGSIPLGLWDLPALMTLDLTNNSLTGTLPKAVASAAVITTLRLGSNRLRGTLPLALTTLSHLADLDLSDNAEVTGTLPRMNWMQGLQSLSISKTKVSGTIPHELSLLPYLELVDLRDTQMTCCASRNEAEARRANGTLLPPFLTLNDLAGPRKHGGGEAVEGAGPGVFMEEEFVTAGGNMKCGMVKRSPQHALVSQGYLARSMNVAKQHWYVDASYTWFMRCSCLKGFEPGGMVATGFPTACGGLRTTGNASSEPSSQQQQLCEEFMSVMTCKPSPKVNAGLISGIVVGGVVLLLLLATVNLFVRRVRGMRRKLEWWRKHLLGLPHGGQMSIVVTDIEGYSGLFKRAPEQMYRALTLHNGVIRRAKYCHCGSIIQQEGDSFTLVFHTAFDATAFCLQVQQGLMEVAWPEGMDVLSEDGSGSSNSSDGSSGPASTAANGSGNSSPPRRKLSHRLEGVSSMLLHSRRSRLAGGSSPPPPPRAGSYSAAQDADVGPLSDSPRQAAGLQADTTGYSPSSSATSSPTKLQAARSRPAPLLLMPGGAFASASSTGASSKLSWAAASGRAKAPATDVAAAASSAGKGSTNGSGLFNGLRVRMGIASGTVPWEAGSSRGDGTSLAAIMDSSLCKLALEVSDAGSGGQVLMDAATFVAVKDELAPLGLVDGDGIDYAQLATLTRQQASPWQLLASCGWGRRPSKGRRRPRQAEEAVVLDMGLWEKQQQPQLQQPTTPPSPSRLSLGGAACNSLPGAMPLRDTAGGSLPGCLSTTGSVPTSPGSNHGEQQAAGAWGFWTAPATHGQQCGDESSHHHHHQLLRLYQILPPSLADRALAWGSSLSLRGRVCKDACYFEAPGALCFSLSTGVSSGSFNAAPSMQPDSVSSWTTRSQQLPSHCLPPVPPHGNSIVSPLAALKPAASRAGAAGLKQSAGDVELALAQLQLQFPRPLLPPVTLLFVSVEGGKLLRKALAREAHCLLAGLFMEALRHVPGAYMCRMQAGDLRYMVAFSTAPAALQWALTVQEASLYLNYSAAAERGQLRCVYDGRGRLVFRGPRLRVGLCEGVPRAMLPDHAGRADYYGSSINQAARMADAAAHGGQIALELDLALAVLKHWGGGSSSTCSRGRAGEAGSGCSSPTGHWGSYSHGHVVAQQQQQQLGGSEPSTPVSSSASQGAGVAAVHHHQQQQPSQFTLPDVQCEAAGVVVLRLGAFRFKGCQQVIHMANVCLADLAPGRQRVTPGEPPKGKGERVLPPAPGSLVAAEGCAPLPALVQQYRARVPLHLLEDAAAVDDVGGLRVASEPQLVVKGGGGGRGPGHQRQQQQQVVVTAHGLSGSGADGELVERQRSHSFTSGVGGLVG